MGREAGENEKGLLDCSLAEITTFKCQGTNALLGDVLLLACECGSKTIKRRNPSTIPILN